ncbi:MAG: MBL fold metallo-hydrolase [Capsulimonas sp.]|uniref:MBL fold metallo-hydrolase n=1 Tax=Capsulimonas sp. TaxID=2494211 RepID=UPI003264583C
MIKRNMAIVAAALALGAVGVPAGAQDFGAAAQPFQVGKLQVTTLHDKQNLMPNDGKVIGVDVGPAAVSKVLASKGKPTDKLLLSVDALAIKTGKGYGLIDTGLGPKAKGSLPESMALAHISPASVTDVLITHSHGDHIGGLVNADGGYAFPNAKVRMSAKEWTELQGRQGSEDVVKAIGSHVVTFTPGKAILPGITPVALYGHTQGSVGYLIVSGKSSLMDIGDTAHSSVISLERPEWRIKYDENSPEAIGVRKATLKKLAAGHTLVFAPHFPYPGVGRIAKDGVGYQWKPSLR